MTYDVLIVGAGPAGAVAAALLAKRGRSVALLDVQDLVAPTRDAEWVNALVKPHLKAAGVPSRNLLTDAFNAVTFYSDDLSRSITSRVGRIVGYLVDRTQFDAGLAAAAVAAGAERHTVAAVCSVAAGEDSIQLDCGSDGQLAGRVMIGADGSQPLFTGPTALGRGIRNGASWHVSCRIARAAEPTAKRRRAARTVSVALGPGRGFAYVFPRPACVAVGVSRPGSQQDADAGFAAFCAAARTAGLIPDRPDATDDHHAFPIPSALDMDSHVGKRMLLIGDAGGFLAAVSHEAVYPGIWSAELAAQTVDRALDADNVQDALAGFDTLWRTTMADYLRMPNTDVQFLWPLVFSNLQMADKMAAAFLTGENI